MFLHRISIRLKRLWEAYPGAVELLAVVTEAAHRAINGSGALLRGTHSEDCWGEILRGESPFPLYDLCRLAQEPTREARATALAIVEPIAHVLGYTLVPIAPAQTSLVEAAIFAEEAAAAAHAEVTRAIAGDGQIDAVERERCRSRAVDLRRAAAALEAAADAESGR